MTVQTKRQILDFLVNDYQTNKPKVQLLPNWPLSYKGESEPATECIMRWYLCLQGEDAPFSSHIISSQGKSTIYRYDWVFGITLLKGYYWNWQKELRIENSLAIHLLLEPEGNGPEAIPISATLSALHPSRNTKSFWELALPKITKAGADFASSVEDLPYGKYLESGLVLASNMLDSQAENRKNWFLYQFLDEERKCPTVEWRINKDVLVEYGPLLRGSLFLAFSGSTSGNPSNLRISLRPQIGYYPKDDLCFIVPTDKLAEDQQVYIDVKPQIGGDSL